MPFSGGEGKMIKAAGGRDARDKKDEGREGGKKEGRKDDNA